MSTGTRSSAANQSMEASALTENTVVWPSVEANCDGLLPQYIRKRRRSKEDRGLPGDAELKALAQEYLVTQRQLWPELAKSNLIPESTEETLLAMVEDFKQRHRSERLKSDVLSKLAHLSLKFGGMYARYSCDNSNPLSINDQMAKILKKAADEKRFIPWSYVFGDYSITGRDSLRQGYSSYKRLLDDGVNRIETTYIDDFTRASRDEIEWWRLAALSKRLNKRMVGASDGFDLSSPNSDIMIVVFLLVSRLFLKGLSEKVKRGMAGAARRGTSLGKQSLGFTRIARRGANGEIVRGSDGLAIYDICIDPVLRNVRETIYELFVDQQWTPYRIARHFNLNRVGDWYGWTETGIRKVLRNASSIGVFLWNKTRREYNADTGKWTIESNPLDQWIAHYDPELAIIDFERWFQAQSRLALLREASPLTGRKLSRNMISVTTLFSGTLFCGSCGSEMLLIRSTPAYQQIGCMCGKTKSHGCQVSSSKSVRVVEECLLNYIRDILLTDKVLEQLVDRVNQLVVEESKRPRTDTTSLITQERKLEGNIRKFVNLIERTDD